MDELGISSKQVGYKNYDTDFTDIGRIKLNRKKQEEGIVALSPI
jgi:hypothetical protein